VAKDRHTNELSRIWGEPEEESRSSPGERGESSPSERGESSPGERAESSPGERGESSSGERGDPSRDEPGQSRGGRDASEVAAPSIGPNTVIEREPPEQRLARHDQSRTDAMGLDKRRQVIGGGSGPSLARQATIYGIFIVVIAAIAVGAKLLVDDLHQPPAKISDRAPWAQEGVKQRPPRPLE
jgi:hypothetical protein